MRPELKKPIGKLIRGTTSKTVAILKKILEEKTPPLFSVVGDFSSFHILKTGLKPDLIILDNIVMRKRVTPFDYMCKKTYYVKNLPGTVDANVWEVLREAVTLKSRAAVIVEGEEDLMVLPLIDLAPIGSIIVYGQPNEGLVVVEVTKERKIWVKEFFSRMEG